MSYSLPDHPDIRSALLTGYPVGGQPKPIYCGECGCKLLESKDDVYGDEDIYEDKYYDYLCKECLLMLHKKVW